MTTPRPDIPVCDQCKQRHVRMVRGTETQACIRHLGKNSPNPGAPCSNAPRRGQLVCGHHGGNTPQALAAADARLAEQDARRAVEKLIPDNPTPIRDPLGVLAVLAGEADEVRRNVAALINQLTADEKITLDHAQQTHALVLQHERWWDRSLRACESLIKSNYLERHAAVEEAHAAALIAVVQRGLQRIDNPDLRRAVTAEIETRLRQLAGPAA